MEKFFVKVFCDVDGQPSFKRIASAVVLVLVVAIVIGVTFFHATLNITIWTDLVYMLCIMLGYITTEKFTKRRIPADTDKTTQQ